MAHARTANNDARVIEQCTSGRRVRNVSYVPMIVANARTNMVDPNQILADSIQSSTVNKAIFCAPCVCEVVRCFVNATNYIECAAGGTVTTKMTKAVIGDTDVDLCSTIAISGESGLVPTAETAIDGTLSTTSGALDLLDGQLVYGITVVSAHNVNARSGGLILCVEWVPKDKP